MNYYEKRLKELDKENLPNEVFSDGRDVNISNDEFLKILKVGDKIYTTVWFLRNIDEIDKVREVAENGLNIVEIGSIYVSELSFRLGSWIGGEVPCLFFKEIYTPMKFDKCINQKIWKINDKNLLKTVEN